jgi:multidrug efflux pump subunit AcrB
VTLTANLAGDDLGRAGRELDAAIARAGTPPRGARVVIRGQVAAMRETFANTSAGLAVAVVVIFILLAATFQSWRLALVVVSTVPAVLAGVVLMLAATRTTVNVQSFMGAIMAWRWRTPSCSSPSPNRRGAPARRQSTPRSRLRNRACGRC